MVVALQQQLLLGLLLLVLLQLPVLVAAAVAQVIVVVLVVVVVVMVVVVALPLLHVQTLRPPSVRRCPSPTPLLRTQGRRVYGRHSPPRCEVDR